MPRIARMVIKGEPAVYHAWGVEPNCCSTVLMSRTVLDDFVLGDIEKEYLLKLIRRLSSIYFAEVLGFLSRTGIMEPPMIGVMEPAASGRKRVSRSGQFSFFHPLSQGRILSVWEMTFLGFREGLWDS